MDAYTVAREAVTDAYLNGRLIPFSFSTCAFGRIVERGMGYPDTDWGDSFTALALGIGSAVPFERYEQATGLSFEEAYEIEAAFEGSPMVPGVTRGASKDIIGDRYARVMLTLDRLERA